MLTTKESFIMKVWFFVVAFLTIARLAQAEEPACKADIDGNGIVDIADFLIFTQHFGKTDIAPCESDTVEKVVRDTVALQFDHNATFQWYQTVATMGGDLDGDGGVGFSDYLIFVSGLVYEGSSTIQNPDGARGDTTITTVQNGIVEQDSLALVALYNAINLEGYFWLDGSPVKDWKGVRVNAEGHVDSLHLSFLPSQISLPAAIGNLSGLEYLWIEAEKLVAENSTIWMGLPNLRHLTLGYISGNIPSGLDNLTNLKHLNLFGMSGQIPEWIGNMTSLETLDLSNYGTSPGLTGSIPVTLGNLTTLRYLILSHNNLTGSIPAELGNLKNLSELRLQRTMLTGQLPESLLNLTLFRFLFDSSVCVPHNRIFSTWLSNIDNAAQYGSSPGSWTYCQ